MPDAYDLSHAEMETALKKYRSIAIVGISDKPYRPSYDVARFMKEQGYRIYPVNPSLSEVLGEKCYASLLDIPEPVEIVDVFRKSEDLLPVAKEAALKHVKMFWMQLGIRNESVAQYLSEQGIKVVMDRCIKIEVLRLSDP